MRKFNAQTAIATIELEQLVTDYFWDVDMTGGRDAPLYYTEDCIAEVGKLNFKGHDGVKKFYQDRLDSIHKTQKDGVRTSRHVVTGIQVIFENEKRATVNFLVSTFAASGKPPLPDSTLVVAVSDSRFECRLDDDGHWRIMGFYGGPIFVGQEEFARKALGFA